jgi:2'-5' RNA ligase
MRKRLFVAIDIPLAIKEKIVKIQEQLLDKEIKAVLVKPENMHLTIIFLGDVDYNQIPEIIELLSKIKDDSFKIEFEALGGFPSLKNAHTLWLGLKENLALYYLREKISQQIKKLNLRLDEKEFVPHLTLARLKRPRNCLGMQFDARGLDGFWVKEFILYQSELSSDRPKHRPMKKFCLR